MPRAYKSPPSAAMFKGPSINYVFQQQVKLEENSNKSTRRDGKDNASAIFLAIRAGESPPSAAMFKGPSINYVFQQLVKLEENSSQLDEMVKTVERIRNKNSVRTFRFKH